MQPNISEEVKHVTLLTQNGKIKSTGEKHGVRLFNFGIPAYQSRTGLKTCPLAGTCAKGCYARQGAYVWSNVASVFEDRLQVTLQPNFAEIMTREIQRKRANVIRIHDSGDFYSLEYVSKWFTVCNALPNVRFYAYTKMVPLFKRLQEQGRIPKNLTLIYSYGGKADSLIDPRIDRHSAVFPDLESLVAAGYAYANDDDLVAIDPSNHKIGLVYHGANSKRWSVVSGERV